MRGVCWEASGPIDSTGLVPLRELGVDWISETPFGWVASASSDEIRFGPELGMWGETDEGLSRTADWARALGIRTLLKPHLWVRHGGWSGDIAMADANEWARWFASYEAFILHYARLAESRHFEALAVGAELARATEHTAEWKRLIARVRAVYHGRLTYCANWDREVERIGFWSDLDFIGVQAYYPLANGDHPSRAPIDESWRRIARRLEALAHRTGKPIVFTEVGFKSQSGALAEPWRWEAAGAVDTLLQRDAYASMFEALWDEPWFAGTFVWKWHPSIARHPRDPRDFTPQGKPALAVIRRYYAGR
jgi:hypothetical protein